MDNLDSVKEEVKRIDHLFFVSLKYTRTVDIIKSILERMSNALEFGFDALLAQALKNKQIKEAPTAPMAKCNEIKRLFAKDERVLAYAEFYSTIKDLIKASYIRKEEYRRHVAMISELEPGKFTEVNIDILGEYYKNVQAWVELLEELLK